MARWICDCECACSPNHELKCEMRWFESGWECPYNNKPYLWQSQTSSQKLTCKNCRWSHFNYYEGEGNEYGVPYLRHPANGWWEPTIQHDVFAPTLLCDCEYLDRKGYPLAERTPFFTTHRDPIFAFHKLVIDYIHGPGIVKYFDVRNPDFSDDVGPTLHFSDVVAVPSLKPLLSVRRMLRLRRLQNGESALAHALPLMALHRFRCCSREIWRAVGKGKSDDAWVRACKLQWKVVVKDFTEDDMRRNNAAYVDTVCYLAQGNLVRLVRPPRKEDCGWLWVAFRLPYATRFGYTGRQGYIHPGILEAQGALGSCPRHCNDMQ